MEINRFSSCIGLFLPKDNLTSDRLLLDYLFLRAKACIWSKTLNGPAEASFDNNSAWFWNQAGQLFTISKEEGINTTNIKTRATPGTQMKGNNWQHVHVHPHVCCIKEAIVARRRLLWLHCVVFFWIFFFWWSTIFKLAKWGGNLVVCTGSEIKTQNERESVYTGKTPATICQTNPPWALILCPLLSLRFLFSGKQLWCLAGVQWDSKAPTRKKIVKISSCKKQ